MFVVYRHTNLSNNKAYIGYTSSTIEKRWAAHVRDAERGSSLIFHRAIRKYGTDGWKHETLESCLTRYAAQKAEIQLIAKHETFVDDHPDKGYNMTQGGETATRGWRHTPAARQAITEALTGRPVSEATRQKMSESQLGRVISDEHKKRLGETLRGRKLTPETVKKIRESRAGYQHSMATRRKISRGNATYGNLPVVQCDMAGVPLRVFETMIDAAEAVGGKCGRIHSVILGKMKQHKGFTWMSSTQKDCEA